MSTCDAGESMPPSSCRGYQRPRSPLHRMPPQALTSWEDPSESLVKDTSTIRSLEEQLQRYQTRAMTQE